MHVLMRKSPMPAKKSRNRNSDAAFGKSLDLESVFIEESRTFSFTRPP
jgi:hypothetical protein